MTRPITVGTSLDNLKKEAKRWLKAIRSGDAEARARMERAGGSPPGQPGLRDVQRAIANEYGYSGWTALVERLAQDAPIRRYQRVAEALVTAYRTGDPPAMQIVHDHFGHRRTWDSMRRYVRLDLGRREPPQGDEGDDLTIADARYLVARAQRFESWEALEAFAALVRDTTTLAERAVGAYSGPGEEPAGEIVYSRDWQELLDIIDERELTGLNASGQMTDALLARVSQQDHLTALDLGGSKALTDDGLRHLARMPALRHLNLAGCARLSDAGLEVLRRLPALETINLAWTRTTDHGAAHLAACHELQKVDLSGTECGDGAVRALAGKERLRHLRSGNALSDGGFAALHDLPAMKTWEGGHPEIELFGFAPKSTFLMLRGPFTDGGMAQLAGLDGLFGLNVDSSQLRITGRSLVPLAALPHLGWLAFDARDESMPHIAALPHLRFLMCQDTSAGDEGFVALSRSKSLEYIWGRRCHNLQRRGFSALADLPALRGLSVSCLNVDEEGLSALPRFPSLVELMPMDVPDEGYRHIGRCTRLESLVLMYCRDTGDRATEHIGGLANLRRYFASYNRITDRTPQILSGISSLEEITFDTCAGVTNHGIAALARLPRLRRLSASGMPRVTPEVAAAFGQGVRVEIRT
jgi:hypothetical protein